MRRPISLLAVLIFVGSLIAIAGCSKEAPAPEPTAASQVPSAVKASEAGSTGGRTKEKPALPTP